MSHIPRYQQLLDEKKGEVDGDKTYQALCESHTICEALNGLYVKSNRFLDDSLRDVRAFGLENIEGFSDRGY